MWDPPGNHAGQLVREAVMQAMIELDRPKSHIDAALDEIARHVDGPIQHWARRRLMHITVDDLFTLRPPLVIRDSGSYIFVHTVMLGYCNKVELPDLGCFGLAVGDNYMTCLKAVHFKSLPPITDYKGITIGQFVHVRDSSRPEDLVVGYSPGHLLMSENRDRCFNIPMANVVTSVFRTWPRTIMRWYDRPVLWMYGERVRTMTDVWVEWVKFR